VTGKEIGIKDVAGVYEEEYDEMMSINLTGVVLCIAA